jgi:hypothetical protein
MTEASWRELPESDRVSELPVGLPRFCKTWFTSARERGTVEDYPRSGRPPILPEHIKEELAKIVASKKPHNQKIMQSDPQWQAIEQDFQPCSVRTMWSGAQQYDISKVCLVEFREQLSAELMQLRLEAALDWVGKATTKSNDAASGAAGAGSAGAPGSHPGNAAGPDAPHSPPPAGPSSGQHQPEQST